MILNFRSSRLPGCHALLVIVMPTCSSVSHLWCSVCYSMGTLVNESVVSTWECAISYDFLNALCSKKVSAGQVSNLGQASLCVLILTWYVWLFGGHTDHTVLCEWVRSCIWQGQSNLHIHLLHLSTSLDIYFVQKSTYTHLQLQKGTIIESRANSRYIVPAAQHIGQDSHTPLSCSTSINMCVCASPVNQYVSNTCRMNQYTLWVAKTLVHRR